MFDFDALAEKQNKRSSLKSFKALLLNDKWFAVRGNNKYPIELEKDICNKFRYRFSSNTNDYYSPFTIKKYYTINKPNYEDYGFWTVLRPGLKIKGLIRNDKFILNLEDLAKTLEDEYKNSFSSKGKS